MKYLEPYQDRDSLIHHLDGRLKLLAALTFIIAVTAVPVEGWPALLLLAGLAGLAVIAAHISPLDLFKRSAAALPFAGMAVLSLPFTQPGRPIWSAAVWSLQWTITAQGLRLAAVLMVKVWLSVLIGGLLVATTPFTRLLQALELLRVPPVLVTIMSFMYRYLFVLVDEAMRLQTARQARSVGRDGAPGGRRGAGPAPLCPAARSITPLFQCPPDPGGYPVLRAG